jgi:myo-inositol 2-dehydrogenase / D-chiro-inositol 1-dehydrogenase
VTVRVGLVGAGGVGARHARTLAGFEDVDLVAICDPVARSAEVLAGDVAARHVPDLAGLLTLGLDAVWLCVPPFAHGDLELSVVRAALPFFVEKPLAADLSVAEHVAAEVSAAGLPTATGYHWRHLDTVGRARSALCSTSTARGSGRNW